MVKSSKMIAFFGTGIPFYKIHLKTTQFYAGNAFRMNAASTIKIAGVITSKGWTMRVPCKQKAVL